jgi:hypothetical protein
MSLIPLEIITNVLHTFSNLSPPLPLPQIILFLPLPLDFPMNSSKDFPLNSAQINPPPLFVKMNLNVGISLKMIAN